MDTNQRRPIRRRSVTLHDVAARSGVCAATVSRALKHDPRISSATIQRVTAIAQEMGYDPSLHEAARRMVLSRHGLEVINHVVALVFPVNFFETAYFSGVYRGMIDVLTAERFAPLLTHILNLQIPNSPITLPRIFDRGEVDGVLMLDGGPLAFQRLTTHLREATGFRERPVVSLIWSMPDCSSVVTDDQQGAYQATRHLLDLGHRHFLHYFNPDSDEVYIKRRAGVCQALEEYGLDVERHQHALAIPYGWHNPATAPLQLSPDGSPDGGGKGDRTALLQFLHDHPEITAVMTPNDGAALHIWYALCWAGWRVPDDYSIVGFDDTDPMPDEHGANLLTTVRLPLEELGRQAARLFVRRVSGEAPEDEQLTLATELIVRASTAAPRIV